MDQDEAMARAAGLDRAWAEHQADVRDAIRAAATLRANFQRTTDASAEPTPAHRAPKEIRR